MGVITGSLLGGYIMDTRGSVFLYRAASLLTTVREKEREKERERERKREREKERKREKNRGREREKEEERELY